MMAKWEAKVKCSVKREPEGTYNSGMMAKWEAKVKCSVKREPEGTYNSRIMIISLGLSKASCR